MFWLLALSVALFAAIVVLYNRLIRYRNRQSRIR